MPAAGAAAAVRPAALTARLREIGARWAADIRAAGDRTKALYLPLLRAAPPVAMDVRRDLRYGPAPRQVLDLYRPAGAQAAPVVAFVHGGAFVRGDKDINDQMYANVLRWFARHGWLGVNVEYRLAPGAAYPEGAVDVGLACAWLQRHAPAHGGDPRRLCLIGHSAGGTHVASLLCDPHPALAGVAHGVAAAALVSARLQADLRQENPNAQGVRAYYGERREDLARHAPMAHAARLAVPTIVVNAEFENPLLDGYGMAFAQALAEARGAAAPHVVMTDHNHVSVMAHLDSGEQALGERLIGFFDAAGR